MSIRVIIADDHPLVRKGLRSYIGENCEDIKIVGEASNGMDVLEMAKNNAADVYILDISMPILNGVETIVRLIKIDPRSKIIILSIHDNRSFVEKALRSGAKGYVLKESEPEEVIRAIREVYRDRYFLSPAIAKFIVNGFLDGIYIQNMKVANITNREREILQLIGEGHTSKEIATNLYLSLDGVQFHRKNIMRKLGIHKHGDLVRYAIKEGLAKL